MDISSQFFGKSYSGEDVHLFTLRNSNRGMLQVTNFGAIIVGVYMPNQLGKLENLVLGYENLAAYLEDKDFLGATVGRFANRLSKGKFELDGKHYQLDRNYHGNHLHGGEQGFHKVLWEPQLEKHQDWIKLHLHYLSKDGEEGYPGNLKVRVSFGLNMANELSIEYEATVDKPTIINFTNHSYFNLSGNPDQDILNHRVYINATEFTPTDSQSIPTGEIVSVEGTPLDFTTLRAVGERIEEDFLSFQQEGGYDHNYVLDPKGKGNLEVLAATVQEPVSGRSMEMYTTEPGVQFFSGNNLKRQGLCLETQHFPDSPNNPNFPSTILRPGENYSSTTIYKFKVK
ncbi:MAG: galactose mutarotase [Bacteroidetes bacterium]|nr:galactose mutarotase [Bacteroidota bacterium]